MEPPRSEVLPALFDVLSRRRFRVELADLLEHERIPVISATILLERGFDDWFTLDALNPDGSRCHICIGAVIQQASVGS